MSTTVIIGNGAANHAAISRVLMAWPNMLADEQAAAIALFDKHREEIAALKCQGTPLGD